MEKIYEEKKTKKKKKNQIKVDGTSILSFVVAIFALVSLVSFGVSGGLSYALPDVSELPQSFSSSNGTTYFPASIDGNEVTMLNSGIELHYGSISGGTPFPVYCLQQETPFCGNTTYNKNTNKAIDNAGLLYLLANLDVNKMSGYSSFTTKTANEKEIYQLISQMALWYYLKQNGSIDSSLNDDERINQFTNYTVVSSTMAAMVNDLNKVAEVPSGQTLFTAVSVNGKTVKQLIDKAIEVKNKTAITFAVDTSTIKLSKSTDNKYEVTSPIVVQGSVQDSSIGTYTGYTVAFSGDVPNGSYIAGTDGKKKTTFAAGEKFIVYVPVGSVKDKAATIKLSITGNFDKYTGYYYTASGNCQQVTSVENVVDHPLAGAQFTIAPDTGVSSAQTIYFIGLVVLLCGVGIIYANAKPSAQRQVQQQEQ